MIWMLWNLVFGINTGGSKSKDEIEGEDSEIFIENLSFVPENSTVSNQKIKNSVKTFFKLKSFILK